MGKQMGNQVKKSLHGISHKQGNTDMASALTKNHIGIIATRILRTDPPYWAVPRGLMWTMFMTRDHLVSIPVESSETHHIYFMEPNMDRWILIGIEWHWYMNDKSQSGLLPLETYQTIKLSPASIKNATFVLHYMPQDNINLKINKDLKEAVKDNIPAVMGNVLVVKQGVDGHVTDMRDDNIGLILETRSFQIPAASNLILRKNQEYHMTI
ncbi:hypothetical protein BDZ94DRAFT_1234522 [Collybia nuda]|uniref:Uncharacterized protein n=1 Tax=Collybia nuda TaxID=64659 RepID=A0A9P6CMD9_9AGAR|nr:hypothetical protein BDZ94DRAFT_1234522 [Collybia nuda]